jgi:hypothetical protein
MVLFFDCSGIPRGVEILVLTVTVTIFCWFRVVLEHGLCFFLSNYGLELQPLFFLLFK